MNDNFNHSSIWVFLFKSRYLTPLFHLNWHP
jgi:hypothetical protein